MIHEYEKLRVFQKSVDLAIEVIRLARTGLPFKLEHQLIGSAVSIPSNIAEGGSRGTDKQFILFLSYASGSAAELNTQLLIVEQIDPGKSSACQQLRKKCVEVSKMLRSLIASKSN